MRGLQAQNLSVLLLNISLVSGCVSLRRYVQTQSHADEEEAVLSCVFSEFVSYKAELLSLYTSLALVIFAWGMGLHEWLRLVLFKEENELESELNM